MTTSQQSDEFNESTESASTESPAPEEINVTATEDVAAEETPAASSSSGATEPEASEPKATESEATEPVAPEAEAETSDAEATPAPAAAVTPKKPVATPLPTPAAAKSAKNAEEKPASAPVAAPPAFSTPLDEAEKFARVTEDGHVFVIVDGQEFPVGQYPDATKEEALAYFVRKHDDVVSQVMLLEQRIVAKAPAGDMNKAADHLSALVAERLMVGDIAALEARLETVKLAISNLQAEERKTLEERRAKELEAREAIVAEAEEISGKDPSQIMWKQASARMTELFDAWKAAQKNGLRLGKATEDALWKRFRGARTTFDRHRRAYFSQLDADNSAAKQQKEKLIARAEELQTSTDWGNTATEYRKLMDEWKQSKRASRKDDDALWARFRAAQDVFFEARQAANQVVQEEFEGNLKVKEALLEEARAIVPVKNLNDAKKKLDSIRERWEAAGKVPRKDMQRIEAGLRQIEDEVKNAEDDQWRRSNPEKKARTNSMLTQLEDAIADLEDDLAKAQAQGNQKKIKQAEEALAARRLWLETLTRSAKDLS
ncbi:DUF349 domain-containing protein [Neomicrococcus aestuarii]|uniref:ATPase n=1 Tax=Neomicrococcus aestuarii TaxID=556325 RepID=A0A1L2ZM05_9MICC|nr:DUF349 domain-containing protein [Neomicrococcus aestuarii]APF40042.1 ATPase [Neomicrococcus aestuarii]